MGDKSTAINDEVAVVLAYNKSSGISSSVRGEHRTTGQVVYD
jgi:hypothetical protein